LSAAAPRRCAVVGFGIDVGVLVIVIIVVELDIFTGRLRVLELLQAFLVFLLTGAIEGVASAVGALAWLCVSCRSLPRANPCGAPPVCGVLSPAERGLSSALRVRSTRWVMGISYRGMCGWLG
jgi:hypothetical protein